MRPRALAARGALLQALWCCARAYTTSLQFRRDLEAFFGALPYGDGVALSKPVPDRYKGCRTEIDDRGHNAFRNVCEGRPDRASSDVGLPQRSAAPVSPFTVLELGIHEGSTTALLSVIFERVIAVDVDPTWLQKARVKQDAMRGRPNVVFLAMDLYGDNWMSLQANQIEVVFIDAAHDYPSVKSDTMQSLQIPSVQWLVFHDYHETNKEKGIIMGMQVREVVDEFVDFGLITCGSGSLPPPPALPPHGGALGAVVDGLPEAVVCRVVLHWQWHAGFAQIAFVGRTESKFVRRAWYFYPFIDGSLKHDRLGGPSAMCQVRGDRVICEGEIQGRGSVGIAAEQSDARTQIWYLEGSEAGQFGKLRAFVNDGFTALNGHYESGHFRRNYIALSGDSWRSLMRKELNALSLVPVGLCCPGATLFGRAADSAQCQRGLGLYAGYAAQYTMKETCPGRNSISCSVVTECKQQGNMPFKAKFGMRAWLDLAADHMRNVTDGSPNVAAAKAFYKALLAAEPAAEVHAEFCLPCRRVPSLGQVDEILYTVMMAWASYYRPGVMTHYRAYEDHLSANCSDFGEVLPATNASWAAKTMAT